MGGSSILLSIEVCIIINDVNYHGLAMVSKCTLGILGFAQVNQIGKLFLIRNIVRSVLFQDFKSRYGTVRNVLKVRMPCTSQHRLHYYVKFCLYLLRCDWLFTHSTTHAVTFFSRIFPGDFKNTYSRKYLFPHIPEL